MKILAKYIGVALIMLGVGFYLGYKYISKNTNTTDLYIVNTVGNQLSESNRLYSALSNYDKKYQIHQNKYNLDMLTIVDCSPNTERVIKSTLSDEEVQYFVKGVRDTLYALDQNGVDRKKIVLCSGGILKFVEEK